MLVDLLQLTKKMCLDFNAWNGGGAFRKNLEVFTEILGHIRNWALRNFAIHLITHIKYRFIITIFIHKNVIYDF